MYSTSPQWDALVGGVHEAEPVVQAWYGQELTASSLDVIDGTYRAVLEGDAVRSSIEVTVDAHDGLLYPVGATAPLSPYGQTLMLDETLRAGGWTDTVPVGTYLIDSPQADGQWVEHRTRIMRLGDQVQVQGVDLLQRVQDRAIRGLAQPKSTATVTSELQRLCRGIVPVDTSNIPTTTVVGKGMVYDTDRLATIQSLARVVGMVPRMSRAGVLELAAVARTSAADWDVTVERRRWIDSVITHTRDGIYNVVEVVGADPGNGRNVKGSAAVTGGPFGTRSPLGERVLQIQTDLVRSTVGATKMAGEELAKSIAGRQVTFAVQTVWNPAVDVLDTHRVTVLPDRTTTGDRLRVLALVTGIDWSLLGGPMTITYSVPLEDIASWLQ